MEMGFHVSNIPCRGRHGCPRPSSSGTEPRREDRPGSWQFPQGGIEADEEPPTAMSRELAEEVGLTPLEVELVAELPEWLGYELPEALRSEKTGRGQVHRWFVLRSLSDEPRIDLGQLGRAEFRAHRWMEMSEAVDSGGDVPTARLSPSGGVAHDDRSVSDLMNRSLNPAVNATSAILGPLVARSSPNTPASAAANATRAAAPPANGRTAVAGYCHRCSGTLAAGGALAPAGQPRTSRPGCRTARRTRATIHPRRSHRRGRGRRQ